MIIEKGETSNNTIMLLSISKFIITKKNNILFEKVNIVDIN